MRRLALAAAALLVLAAPGRAAACRAIAVSGSIQAAVDQAQPCDWVLVPPGVYREDLAVRTPDVRVRGLNRNLVVVDGAGVDVEADRVTLENLTVRGGGIRWDGVHGWKGSYLTAYSLDPAAPRGFSATGGTDGSLDHAYAAGFAEAGIACDACRLTVAHAVVERNAVGIFGTGGRLSVRDSLLRLNAVGLRLGPSFGNAIRTSRVEQNDRIGIELSGTTSAVVANNVVLGNRTFGIVGHEGPDPFPQLVGSRITGNVVRGSRYDLGLEGGLYGTLASPDNCVAGNRVRTPLPADLGPWRCGGGTTPNPDPDASRMIWSLVQPLLTAKRTAKQVAPPAQPTLPHPCTGAPANPLCGSR